VESEEAVTSSLSGAPTGISPVQSPGRRRSRWSPSFTAVARSRGISDRQATNDGTVDVEFGSGEGGGEWNS